MATQLLSTLIRVSCPCCHAPLCVTLACSLDEGQTPVCHSDDSAPPIILLFPPELWGKRFRGNFVCATGLTGPRPESCGTWRCAVEIRLYEPGNAEKLCKLFFDAVRVIGLRDYNAHQVEAWAQRTLSPAHAPIRAQGLQGTRATRVPGGQRLDPQLRNGEDALTVEAALTLRAMCGRSGWARKIFTSQRWSRRPRVSTEFENLTSSSPCACQNRRDKPCAPSQSSSRFTGIA